MGSVMVRVLNSLLALLCGLSSVLAQDLRERDALCDEDGCLVVYFQPKTFLESWRACKAQGGNLATVKRQEDAAAISHLFSTLDLPDPGAQARVWIGLQRQPRHCSAHPLRGFSWTTGERDTAYTNWRDEDSPACSSPRCVLMGYSAREPRDNLKWVDGPCSVHVDGFLCRYAYKGMCPALWGEGAGDALYTTPFKLASTLLTHVPLGSVATVPCPPGSKEDQTVLCTVKDDSSVGWSREAPFCSEPRASPWCGPDNGGCEHYCRAEGAHVYCECGGGYQLGDDGRSCEPADVCRGAPCEAECVPLPDGYRCACPDGYMLTPDEHGCADIDECLQSPCEQRCVNAPGSYACGCLDGYRPDADGGCDDVDECLDEPCEHECENTQGSHVCHCDMGFSPVPEDPSRCQDTDECQIPGTCQQMCVNYEGGFDCYCEEGYELMPDRSSCWKTVDPHPPGQVWDPVDYKWTPQTQTDWRKEEVHTVDWLTDTPRRSNPGVIWVTSAPQEPLPLVTPLDPRTQEAGDKGKDGGGAEWLVLGHKFPSGVEISKNHMHATSPPTTSSGKASDPFRDYKEEEPTTANPVFSAVSDWWSESTSHKPEKPTTSHDVAADSGSHNGGQGERDLVRDKENFPGNYWEVTPSHDADPRPTQPSPSNGADILDSDRGQSSTWLLVGLLVPICVIMVVMAALGVVYCARCAAQPRNKNSTDCYHWIAGAHDKQGASSPSAGVKTRV